MGRPRHLLLAAVVPAVVACAGMTHPSLQTGGPGTTLAILQAADLRADGWHDVPIRGRTDYQMVEQDGHSAIMATANRTASGLARRVNIDPKTCRFIRWFWRVDRMQTNVDLRRKSREDVAASLFLTFGNPGFMMAPNPVPSVRYVWTTEHMKKGEVFDNPFRPDIIRTFVVENRSDRLGEWVEFNRDLYADYVAAYGGPPKENLNLVVIFTDNDQSKEPVTAYYGPITVRCS